MVAYVSENADKKIIDSLEQKGFEVKPLAPFAALKSPMDTHADMLLLNVGDKIFKHIDYKTYDIDNLIEINEPISANYPNDVLLNIAIVGKNAFCNIKHASKTILQHLEQNGYSINHVSQGYSHCSTLIVSDNAIITADDGIASKAQAAGIDVLKISSGYISLPPYEYGFIGGASGVTNDSVYFCGSLSHHPSGEEIREFCRSYGKQTVELCDMPLEDIGGILFI